MELREFIKDVLLEITGGVEDAQNASGIQNTNPAIISPIITKSQRTTVVGNGFNSKKTERPIIDVSFDVQLVVSDNDSDGKSMGISIARTLNFKKDSVNSLHNELTQRIQFVVPVILPTANVEKE